MTNLCFSCQCKHNCTMGGDYNKDFGDPCVGVDKHLLVRYECLEPPQEEVCPITNNSISNATMQVFNFHVCGLGREPSASKMR